MSVFRKVKKYWVLIAVVILLIFAFAVWDERIKTAEGSVPVDLDVLIVSEVRRVNDGDTFCVNIEGLHPLFGENICVRIAGIDTPEIRGKLTETCDLEKIHAAKARDFLKGILENAKVIELRNPKRGKYFRIAADVYVDGVNVAIALVEKDLAVSYGRYDTKISWCRKLARQKPTYTKLLE